MHLGSNMGNRESYLNMAIKKIKIHVGMVLIQSSVYESTAWGKEDQADFLNLALSVQTSLSPQELLHKVKGIEEDIGRFKTVHWGPREVDIDIIFYEDDCVDEPGLIIPHSELPNRNFVLIPLMEIASDKVDPSSGMTIEELYMASEDVGEVWFYN